MSLFYAFLRSTRLCEGFWFPRDVTEVLGKVQMVTEEVHRVLEGVLEVLELVLLIQITQMILGKVPHLNSNIQMGSLRNCKTPLRASRIVEESLRKRVGVSDGVSSLKR